MAANSKQTCEYHACDCEATTHVSIMGRPFMRYCRKHAGKVKTRLEHPPSVPSEKARYVEQSHYF